MNDNIDDMRARAIECRLRAISTRREREGCVCRDHCTEYPCFAGMDTIESNLALTCRQFTPNASAKKIMRANRHRAK